MPNKITALIISVLFFSVMLSPASAFTVKAPSSMFVFSEPREFWIEVQNDSGTDKFLDAKFFSPTYTELLEVPDKIKANSTAAFKLRVLPNPELSGQTYESTLVIELGNEKAIKTISIAFKQAQMPEPAEPANPSALDLNAISTGFASLVAIGTENALNIVLIIIAAILLIAFMARFLRRIR